MKLPVVLVSVLTTAALAAVPVASASPSLPAQCQKAPKVLCISKTDRKLRFLVNGRVVLSIDARFGDARGSAFRTKEGSFTIQYREPMSWSKKFHVWMPYSMYFYGHEQAVHYSYAFASEGYSGASHGCVNIRDMAKLKYLFEHVQVGTPVYIYH